VNGSRRRIQRQTFFGVQHIGVPVAFQILAGAGVITPQSALTNSFGEVNAKWTMGPTP